MEGLFEILGSGNFGHAGRPGKVGGSMPKGSGGKGSGKGGSKGGSRERLLSGGNPPLNTEPTKENVGVARLVKGAAKEGNKPALRWQVWADKVMEKQKEKGGNVEEYAAGPGKKIEGGRESKISPRQRARDEAEEYAAKAMEIRRTFGRQKTKGKKMYSD
jgi:hypothetical protein